MTENFEHNVNQIMAKDLNFEKICRACLSSDQKLKNLFEHCSPQVFEYCTSVEVCVLEIRIN